MQLLSTSQHQDTLIVIFIVGAAVFLLLDKIDFIRKMYKN